MSNNSVSEQDYKHLFKRREFIGTTFKAACATALVSTPVLSMANYEVGATAYTVQDIIDLILKEIPGAPFKQTVDTIKSGSGDQKVTGIVTTMFSTIRVIEQAARLNSNFIIAHGPTFYNHTDDLNWIDKNEIVKKKKELLEKHNIAVWRFHDYWHTYVPDGIGFGFLKKQNGSNIISRVKPY